MSFTIQYMCDKCRSAIGRDRTTIAVQIGPMRTYKPTVDLCDACGSALASWLAERPAAAVPSRDDRLNALMVSAAAGAPPAA